MKPKSTKWIVLDLIGLVGLLSLWACNPTESDSSLDLLGGEVAGRDTFPATVALAEDKGLKVPEVFCTASKVAPRIFLTAGHCLYDLRTNEYLSHLAVGESLFVGHGVKIQEEKTFQRLTITRVEVHPEFKDVLGQQDINILNMAADVALIWVDAQTPKIGTAVLESKPMFALQSVFLNGYGHYAMKDFVDGVPVPSPVLKFAKVTIDSVDPGVHAVKISARQHGQVVAGLAGDSGGPVYAVDFKKPHGPHKRIVGIMRSVQFYPNSLLVELNYVSRVDDAGPSKVGTWIKNLIEE